MSRVLHADFETLSELDLPTVGLDNYARHPTTDVWCLAYAFDDEEVDLCEFFRRPGRCPLAIWDHVAAGGLVIAHNAGFEFQIWNQICVPRYGWPKLALSQMRCTMAMANAMALPGSLERAAAAVGIANQKDAAGRRLMLQMCAPKPDGGWWDTPELRARLFDYAKQDVRTERDLAKRLMPLSEFAQQIWELDQKINFRGVYVDRKTVERTIDLVSLETKALDAKLKAVTGGAVSRTSENVRFVKWLRNRGIAAEGVTKNDVIELLKRKDLTPNVRDALKIRKQAGKSSTAKFFVMLEALSARDSRLRGMFHYHGAHTGRWTGRKVQLQNLPRWPDEFGLEEAEEAIKILHTTPVADAARHIDFLYGAPLVVASYLLRAVLGAAPDHELMVVDFANIEGRVLAWLAGEQWKLDAFKAYDDGQGPDLYKLAASKIFNVSVADVSKDQRQVGKVSELACGYQGGVGAFQNMAKIYAVQMPDEQAEGIKSAWRLSNPNIVQYWYDLENAAVEAVLTPGKITSAGPFKRSVKFRRAGSFLWCRLPSGRALCYPYPSIKPRETPWGQMKDCLHYLHDGTEVHTYGGKLSENLTQAASCDILAEAMLRVENAGFPVVLHVHDEVGSEVKLGTKDFAMFQALCSQVPSWATGLPVAVSGWTGKRYRK